MSNIERRRAANREHMRRLRRDPATAERLRAAAREYHRRPEVRERQRQRRRAAWARRVKNLKARLERQQRAEERRLAREAQQARQHEAYERERLAQLQADDFPPSDPRSCRCGAKLSFLVDQWGQAYAVCDACHHSEHFGRHPIKDAA